MKLKKEIWKDINWYLPKDAHQKSDGGSVRSDLKKLDSFTLEMSKNHLIRSFLRNGRLRVNVTLVRREQLSSRSQLVKTFYLSFTIIITSQF